MAATPKRKDQGAMVAPTSSSSETQPPVPQEPTPAIVLAQGQAPAKASSTLSDLGEVHSITASSLPPQITDPR